MTANEVHEVLSRQSRSGAFTSTVSVRSERYQDDNAFVTVLTIRELRRVEADAEIDVALSRAFDFLDRCRSSQIEGGYHFYPPRGEPSWIGTWLPPDVDDTALIVLTLLEADRISTDIANAITDRVLSPTRIHYERQPVPSWLSLGAFMTWVGGGIRPNPIDCCVNANVLALLAALGRFDHPGFRPACETIRDGVAWAGDHPQRLRSLAPFYAHPAELASAAHRAVAYGVDDLAPVAAELSPGLELQPEIHCGWPSNQPVCRSKDGRAIWHAPVLQAARRLLSRTTTKSLPAVKTPAGPSHPLTAPPESPF